MKLTLILSTLILCSSCIRTAEQVRREKHMESISEQVNDSQGLLADISQRLRNVESQLENMNGRMEVIEHNQRKMNPEVARKQEETLTVLKTQQDTQNTQILGLQNEMREQRAFLEKVTTQLSSIGQNKTTHQSDKKKGPREDLIAALSLVQNNNYDKARSALEALIDHTELSPGDQNKVMHGLGRTEYHTKNYEKAMVYFSKIYSKYPKSTLAPSSLLYIGKSLRRLGKKVEAKEALTKLVEDYPGTQEALVAKKEM